MDLSDVHLGAALHWARLGYRSHAPRLLALLLGWAGVWVLVEPLVAGSGSRPGRPVWTILHLGYFWGTAYWEVAMLRSALHAFDGTASSGRGAFLDHVAVLRFLVLKLLLLPFVMLGLVCLVAPGIYGMARLGPAVFFVADGPAGPWKALALSNRATAGRRGPLMLLCLFLLLFNLLGAALLGLGLIVTVPMSLLACGCAFRAISPRGAPR